MLKKHIIWLLFCTLFFVTGCKDRAQTIYSSVSNNSQNFYNPAWTSPADYPSLRKTENSISKALREKTPAYKFNAPAEQPDQVTPEKK